MSSAQLGFTFSTVNSSMPFSVRVGTPARLSSKESHPVCSSCKKYMPLLFDLDHDVMPLAGLMKSKGVSRVFICCNQKCSYFADKGLPNVSVLQTTRSLDATVANGSVYSLLSEDEIPYINSQRILGQGTDSDDCGMVVEGRASSTKIQFFLTNLSPDLVLSFRRGNQIFDLISVTLKDRETTK